MTLPAPASHVLLKVLKVAPVTVKSFDGGGGPPSPIVMLRVAVRDVLPLVAVTRTV